MVSTPGADEAFALPVAAITTARRRAVCRFGFICTVSGQSRPLARVRACDARPGVLYVRSGERHHVSTSQKKGAGMRRFVLVGGLLLLGALGTAQAGTCKGVDFPEHLQVAGHDLVLNGLGMRKATFLKVSVYVGALYV